MIQRVCPVCDLSEVADSTFLLAFTSPDLAPHIRPGQFLNVRVTDGYEPFLRRPFSVYRTDGDRVELVFNVVGRGTSLLHQKRPGEMIDVLGPLGVPFHVDGPEFDTAILVGGGLGVAPLPLTTAALRRAGKNILSFLGGRTGTHLVTSHLESLTIATDDGSLGFYGNVVECLEEHLEIHPVVRPKIFASGPTPMLRALAQLALRENMLCEVSLEGPMACGFGICQGCPVEMSRGEKKYALMCKDGPVFDVRDIIL